MSWIRHSWFPSVPLQLRMDLKEIGINVGSWLDSAQDMDYWRTLVELGVNNINDGIYITIILPVVLYGCETWYLTLREECNVRVFENRILRRIFGPKGG